jgi:hypothetical protein
VGDDERKEADDDDSFSTKVEAVKLQTKSPLIRSGPFIAHLKRLAVTAVMTAATAGMACSTESGAVFVVSIMVGCAYMTAPVPRLISLEVIEGLDSTLRHWATITVTRIEAVIDVAVEAVRAMEPWTGSDE